MPWWSWVLIWTGLVLGLLAMLAWFGFTLFKKLMTAAAALGELGDQVSDLNPEPPEPKTTRFRPAVFEDREDLALALELLQSERAYRRQRRRDSLIARGKLFTTAPLTQRTDPDA